MDLGDISAGSAIKLDNETFSVLKQQHVKMGRGGAVVKAKLKNLKTGAVVDRTIRHGDTFEEADVVRNKATFLYADKEVLSFMDKESFEQFTIDKDSIGDQIQFLIEGTDVDVLYVDDKPTSIELPIKIEFEITDTPPNVKGNTASGGNKPATLSTGAIVTVPLFIKKGDIIRVNTQDGTYVERISNKS